MRIVFFGLPLAALLLADDGHDVRLAYLSRPHYPGERRLRRLLGADRVHPRSAAAAEGIGDRVRAAHPELVVSWFWTKLLPTAVLRAAPLGAIGAHPSLLPRHRGPDPTTWAILSGDAETGVTIHELEAAYDTGAILAQRRLAIDPAWTAWRLARALDRPSLALLRETVARLARGETTPRTAQEESLATEAPLLDEGACTINPKGPTERILRLVLALSPAPGAMLVLGDRCLVVLRAEATRAPPALAHGEVGVVDACAILRTGDGAVELTHVELDGEPLARTELCAIISEEAASHAGTDDP